MMLREEFSSVTSCPLEDEERLFSPSDRASRSKRNIIRTYGPGQTVRRELRE